MRRHRRGKANRSDEQPPLALQISINETKDLIEVLRHARTQITELTRGDAHQELVAKASGSALISSLYARIGLAVVRGKDAVPVLITEIGQVEAAVLNLESYDGHEVVLCLGHALLQRLETRRDAYRSLCLVDGVWAITDETGESASGAAAPSLT
ncbi:hypothetical protein ACH5A7_07410 [Streptomyces sp. NPDC018955]|uniref:hypothetical protein n=1 Tax=Streptomyces sp. NPDC018955 TaxID=3365055 RepID=UPI0037B8440A